MLVYMAAVDFVTKLVLQKKKKKANVIMEDLQYQQ